MSELQQPTGLVVSDGVSPQAAASFDALFVIPSGRGGLWASIRGHVLELADPRSVHGLAPTPDDLFIASIASDLAWSARHFLRAHGLPDDVSVSARSRRLEDQPSPADIKMTVTVSRAAETMSDALEDVLAERVAARSLGDPPRLHLRCAV
jgi:putative redox protein